MKVTKEMLIRDGITQNISRVGRTALVLAMLATPVGAARNNAEEETNATNTTIDARNYVQDFWENTALGEHIDRYIPAANPLFVQDVATELGVDYFDEHGNAKGFSDVIFEWAQQHPELGSVEQLSALGGLGIIKTANGYSVLFEEEGTHFVYDYETDDLRQVVGSIAQRLGITATSYWTSISNLILGTNHQETWDVTVTDEVERSFRMPVDSEGNRLDCGTKGDRQKPECQ